MSNVASVENLRVRLEMKSDWHVGTGAGIPGSIDALIARDVDAFPFVPAKTLVGMWRDAMETWTLGLDNGDEKHKVWQKWVDVIFGSQPAIDKNPAVEPRPAILTVEPARLDEDLRETIGDDKRLKQALTFLKPNTAIDHQSGTPKDESLRITEMGRVGTILEAKCTLDFTQLENVNEDQKNLIKALLVASAALVERIGGNRRRGSGKCQVLANGLMSTQEAIKVLQEYRNKPLDIPAWKPIAISVEASEPASGSTWRKLGYTLRLETPVAIVTNTLGNVCESLDFIPGTYLLPHLSKHLPGVSKYITSGDFQVSPATIDVEGKRGLPVPKVIYHHKVDGGFDTTVDGGFDKKQPGKWPTVYNPIKEYAKVADLTYQKKNYREGYVSSLDGKDMLPFYETTKKTLLMHNTVDDGVQRPTEAVGGVYSRQAISAGTLLRGVIRFKVAIEQEAKKLFNHTSTVRLGTSKKDDYGLAQLTIEEKAEDANVDPAAINNDLIIYLESDVLLRNDNLRQTNLLEEFAAHLNGKLNGNSSTALKPKHNVSLIQARRIESWHEGWGLPRPTFTAMAAGSVAVFQVVGTIDPKKLQELELAGIGERRGEGYGRIRFNPPLLTSPINTWKLATKETPPPSGNDAARQQLKSKIETAEKLKDFVTTVELAAWRDELARAALKLAANVEQRKTLFGLDSNSKAPPMSQVSGLRSVMMRLKRDESNKSIVLQWLKHIEDTPNRREKWKAGFGEIAELFSDGRENLIWDRLQAFLHTPRLLISDAALLKRDLWSEAVQSVFDACARAHKRDMERKEEKKGGAKENG